MSSLWDLLAPQQRTSPLPRVPAAVFLCSSTLWRFCPLPSVSGLPQGTFLNGGLCVLEDRVKFPVLVLSGSGVCISVLNLLFSLFVLLTLVQLPCALSVSLIFLPGNLLHCAINVYQSTAFLSSISVLISLLFKVFLFFFLLLNRRPNLLISVLLCLVVSVEGHTLPS